jgi:predicted glycosyltransferase
VEIRSKAEDAATWLPSASAVVTMAGYNSICEVLRWRRNALAVPRAGPSAEQRIRSHLFAERGLLTAVDPEVLTPGRVAEELDRLLANPHGPDPAAIPPLDGAARTARSILTAVSTPRRRRPKLVGAAA